MPLTLVWTSSMASLTLLKRALSCKELILVCKEATSLLNCSAGDGVVINLSFCVVGFTVLGEIYPQIYPAGTMSPIFADFKILKICVHLCNLWIDFRSSN
jgi:hypothetical protein